MSRHNVNTVYCEALFASSLGQSDTLAPPQVWEAIARTLRTLGRRGCADWVALEYGDYPELAVERMCWARSVVAQAYAREETTAPAKVAAAA
jgi:hypothetical protein